MVSKIISYFHKSKSNNPLRYNLNITKIFFLALSALSFSFFLESVQIFNQVNAFSSQGQTIQDFNNNLRSNIDKQIQSNLNQAIQPFTNNDTSNCNSNDNFVTQSHSSNNGQATVSTNNPSCDASTPTLPFG